MSYRIIYQPNARAELESAIQWSFENYPATAKNWCNKLLDAIDEIAADPMRYQIARESSRFDVEIRQLLFGSARRPYRILFTIDGDLVRVLHIRFPGQPLAHTE